MKKVIIAALIGTVIFFAYQTVMWMGGMHSDFHTYSPAQYEVLDVLISQLKSDGAYMIPSPDPAAADGMKAREDLHRERTGKPWALIFYHNSMAPFSFKYVLVGIFYSFIACLLVSLVFQAGDFKGLGLRFAISMAFSLFTLSQGVLDEMNWWSWPWNFVKPQVIDLTFGWALPSLWFAWYFRRPEEKAAARIETES